MAKDTESNFGRTYRDDLDLLPPDLAPEPEPAALAVDAEKAPDPTQAHANAEGVKQLMEGGQLDSPRHELPGPEPVGEDLIAAGSMPELASGSVTAVPGPTPEGKEEVPSLPPAAEAAHEEPATVTKEAAPGVDKAGGQEPGDKQISKPPEGTGPGTLVAAGHAIATMVAATDKAQTKDAADKPPVASPPSEAPATSQSGDSDLIAATDMPLARPEKTTEKSPTAEPKKADAERAAVKPTEGSTSDRGGHGPDDYIGSAPGKDKDRWTYYDDPKRGRTYGWDVGGAHRVKHAGGQLSAAVTAISKVEGTYDNVQTYDSAVLTFGIFQWTVHAGSLQGFLGYLKYEAGPQARAAFDEHLGSHGIDIKKQGAHYELFYQGALHKGAEDFDKLIRASKETARQWVDWFHSLGVDPRAQKAEFDYGKLQFERVQKTSLTDKVVNDALKRTPKTFHAANRGNYGTVSDWTSQSPKAAVLYVSMTDNNPAYGNAALLKAIDAFYTAQGNNRVKWPKNWPDLFADLFEAKCRETLSTWGDHKNKKGQVVEGRVSKTLRYWNEATQKGADTPGMAKSGAPSKEAHRSRPKAAVPIQSGVVPAVPKSAVHAPTVAHKQEPTPGMVEQMERYAAVLANKVKAGILDTEAAALRFIGWTKRNNAVVPGDAAPKHVEEIRRAQPAGAAGRTGADTHPNHPIAAARHADVLATAGKAFHDGGADKALGAGDEVFEYVKGLNHIIPAFPPTPEGLVEAALYELHRGDKRSMADILADHSARRWERGADAAVEQTTQGDWTKGRGLNDDGEVSSDGSKGKRAIGHATVTNKKNQIIQADAPTGPIQAYKTTVKLGTFAQGAPYMWCGAFVTYCLARCGINVGSLAYAPTVGQTIAHAGGRMFHFDTVEEKVGDGTDRHKNKYHYQGGYYENNVGDAKSRNAAKKEIHSATEIDIRPGDVFFSRSHTGLIVGVNKQDRQIVLRTVEGNSNDRVQSSLRVIKLDEHNVVTQASFEGWGRPAEFGAFAVPPNDDGVTTGKGGHKEAKTT